MFFSFHQTEWRSAGGRKEQNGVNISEGLLFLLDGRGLERCYGTGDVPAWERREFLKHERKTAEMIPPFAFHHPKDKGDNQAMGPENEDLSSRCSFCRIS